MSKVLVIGSLNMDFSIQVDHMPVPGETVLGNQYTLVPGGKGANQAYTLGKLEAEASMIGAVGNDENGSILVENLKKVGVNTSGIKIVDKVNTGTAFINIDSKGENNIVVIPGANHKIDEKWIDENIKLIEEADIIVMQLEIPISIVCYVAKIAKSLGKMVVLDPAPAKKDLPEELFSMVDILKPNETELQILTGRKAQTEEETVGAAQELINKGVKNVIVTLGGKGSLLVTKEKKQPFSAIDLEVVDTTAAGDSFTGALVTALAEKREIEDAINYAHLVSSIVVTKKGAQTSIPTKKEVEEFIKKGE